MSLGSPSTPDTEASKDRSLADPSSFEIGDWLVDLDLLRLRRGEDSRKLEPMAMRLLVFLAERPGRVVSRAEILEEVWEGRAVVDETLSRGMSLVRQALGDNAQEPTYIETIPRRGYRLIAPVRPHNAKSEDSPTANPGTPAALSSEGSQTAALEARGWRKPGLVPLLVCLLALCLVALTLFWVWVGEFPQARKARQASVTTIRETVPVSATGTDPLRRPGVAVLPFKNLSPDPGNAYLADGLTEEITHQLASVSGLRVVSRASSAHFRDSEALAPEIAQVLGVEYLLEGTVLVVDQRLRITAQLIRPDQDDHLLSRSYDRDLSEVLDLQREVAKDVAEQTRTQLSPTETVRLSRNRPVSSDAYRAYLQGQQWIQRRREFDRGLDLLENAVGLDPSFAPAWSALADAYLLANSYAGRSEESAYAGAEAAIGKALGLDPELAAAHASLGLLRLQRSRDWSGSEESYRRAIALEPSYVTARQWYSELLSLLGRHDEALRQVAIALELDPLSPLIHAAAGQRLNAAGRYEEALSRFQDVKAVGADFTWHLREESWALARLGRHPESIAIRLAQAKSRRPHDVAQISRLERAIRDGGMKGFYDWDLERLLAMNPHRPGYPTWLAEAYAGAGHPEKAFEWLGKAAQRRNLWLLHTLKSPAFDALRDDPRFEEALGDLSPLGLETARSKRAKSFEPPLEKSNGSAGLSL